MIAGIVGSGVNMITLQKLTIFTGYDGDGDMFARAGRPKEKQLMSDEDWRLIDTLIQDATVISRNLGSERRTAEAANRIKENCENERVTEQIHLLAETM